MPQKVPVLISFIPNSLTTPNVLSHDDLKKFETIDYGVKQVQKRCISRKCQGCKYEEWRCKLNPREVRRKRLNRSQAVVQQPSYQSYKYGSNGVHNSCHQDSFLEMTYHSFKRHYISPDVNMSQGLTSLLDSFVLRENGKFHESKMTLWKWLRDETPNGHTYYAFGKEATLDSIIYRLLEPMKYGYMHERQVPRRKRKGSKPHNATKKLKTTVRGDSKEDRTMHEQSTEVLLCTEMPSSDSEEDFESDLNLSDS